MPQDTFHNLDKEKQKRIVEAALSEFSDKGYQGANMQVIADRAEVAKGSLYQYFEGKKELFFYLLDLAAQEKTERMMAYMACHEEMPFFDLLNALFSVGIQFAVENPDLYRLLQDIRQGAPAEIRKEFDAKVGGLGRHYYGLLLRKGMEQGDIRRDVSEELAGYVVYTLLMHIGDCFIEKGGSHSTEAGGLDAYARQFVEVLKSGIRRQ